MERRKDSDGGVVTGSSGNALLTPAPTGHNDRPNDDGGVLAGEVGEQRPDNAEPSGSGSDSDIPSGSEPSAPEGTLLTASGHPRSRLGNARLAPSILASAKLDTGASDASADPGSEPLFEATQVTPGSGERTAATESAPGRALAAAAHPKAKRDPGDVDDSRIIGAIFRGYRVTRRIGLGGMGTVYEAEYVSSLHSDTALKAAVKVLKPKLAANEIIVSRFIREAVVATRIKSDGIAKVMAVDRHDSGYLYILMEYLDGESLGERLRRERRLPLDLAISIVRQCARILRRAHHAGIVHRDLKPDNILLIEAATAAEGERVKLLDFGIAKLPTDAVDNDATGIGLVLGTPSYMSPEQCVDSGSVDHRADLYALGCIFYRMLSGQPPFVAPTMAPGADWRRAIIFGHLYQDPPPLSSRGCSVAPEIEAIIKRLLAKEPERRYPSAEALIEALDSACASAFGAYPSARHQSEDEPVSWRTPSRPLTDDDLDSGPLEPAESSSELSFGDSAAVTKQLNPRALLKSRRSNSPPLAALTDPIPAAPVAATTVPVPVPVLSDSSSFAAPSPALAVSLPPPPTDGGQSALSPATMPVSTLPRSDISGPDDAADSTVPVAIDAVAPSAPIAVDFDHTAVPESADTAVQPDKTQRVFVPVRARSAATRWALATGALAAVLAATLLLVLWNRGQDAPPAEQQKVDWTLLDDCKRSGEAALCERNGQRYETGQGVQQNLRLAAECYYYSARDRYQKGALGPALRLFHQACHNGYPNGYLDGCRQRYVMCRNNSERAPELCDVPLVADEQSAVFIASGSNTIGRGLMLDLTRAYLLDRGAHGVSPPQPIAHDKWRVSFTLDGRSQFIEISAHGSEDGFRCLSESTCDIGMASRPMLKHELVRLRQRGILTGSNGEHLLGYDDIAVIVSYGNPLESLSLKQLRAVFAGEITDWSELTDNLSGPIAVMARDLKSGTAASFQRFVLPEGTLTASAQRFEDSRALAETVASNPQAIGFVGRAHIDSGNRPLSLYRRSAATDSSARAPDSPAASSTDEHLLSRALFLYASDSNQAARAFIEFALSPKGQKLVERAGFIGHTTDD